MKYKEMKVFSASQKQALTLFRCVKCHHRMRLRVNELRCVHCDHRYLIRSGGIIDVLPENSGLTPAQRAGQWQVVARFYDRLWRTRALSLLTGRSLPPEEEHGIVLGSLALKKSAIVLDNACANGFSARAIVADMNRRKISGAVIANDISLPMLRTALDLAKEEGVADRILFVRSDSESMPFSSGSFDGAVCGGSLNEFLRPHNVIDELGRVLKPRGRASFMFQIHSDRHGIGRIQRILGRMSGLTFLTLERALSLFEPLFKPTVTLHEGVIAFVRIEPVRSRRSIKNRNSSNKRKSHVKFRRP